MKSLYTFLNQEVLFRHTIIVFLSVYALVWLLGGFFFGNHLSIEYFPNPNADLICDTIVVLLFIGLLCFRNKATILFLRITWESFGFGFSVGILWQSFFSRVVYACGWLLLIRGALLLGLFIWFTSALLSHVFSDQTKAGRLWFYQNLLFLIGAEAIINLIYRNLISWL